MHTSPAAGPFRFRWSAPAALVLLAAIWPVAATPSQPPAWKEAQTFPLKGLKVCLSAPVLVARSKGYLWFPTLVRHSNGDLLALMSNYADIHTNTATSSVSWSGDG